MKTTNQDVIMAFLNDEIDTENFDLWYRLNTPENHPEILKTFEELVAIVYDADNSSEVKLKSDIFLFSKYEDKIIREKLEKERRTLTDEELDTFVKEGIAATEKTRAELIALFKEGRTPVEEIEDRVNSVILAEQIYGVYDPENWKDIFDHL
jgi:hypothetical protein